MKKKKAKKIKKHRHKVKDDNDELVPSGNYPGCWHISSKNLFGKADKIYYCRYKDQSGKIHDCKHGRASEGKTWNTCKLYRIKLIAGVETSAQEKRVEKAAKSQNTLVVIWQRYGREKGRGKKVNGRHVLRSQQHHYAGARGRYERYLLPIIGANTDLTTITARDFERLEKTLDHLAPATVYHIFAELKKFCRMAGNNVEDIAMPSAGMKKTDEDLTPDQLKRLQEVLRSHRNRVVCDMLSFIMVTGCRRGECVRLKREHLDFERGVIKLVDRKAGRTSADTSIPMSKATAAILKRRIRENLQRPGGNQYIFPGRDGGKRGNDSAGRRIADIAGLPKSFRPCHGLRHYFATSLVDAGQPIHVVSRLLGHSTVQMTERYFTAREDALKAASETIGRLMMEG